MHRLTHEAELLTHARDTAEQRAKDAERKEIEAGARELRLKADLIERTPLHEWATELLSAEEPLAQWFQLRESDYDVRNVGAAFNPGFAIAFAYSYAGVVPVTVAAEHEGHISYREQRFTFPLEVQPAYAARRHTSDIALRQKLQTDEKNALIRALDDGELVEIVVNLTVSIVGDGPAGEVRGSLRLPPRIHLKR